VVVCSTGVDASIVAYALKSGGFPHVSLLVGGLLAWRATHGAWSRRDPAPERLQ
jgi:rhodanese-related sulfurtransferase